MIGIDVELFFNFWRYFIKLVNIVCQFVYCLVKQPVLILNLLDKLLILDPDSLFEHSHLNAIFERQEFFFIYFTGFRRDGVI